MRSWRREPNWRHSGRQSAKPRTRRKRRIGASVETIVGREAMDLAALSVLVVLGGYCFAYLWRATTSTIRRADGHHLYFRAALCGSFLFVLALGVRSLLVSAFPAYHSFDSALVEYFRPALKVENGLELLSRERRS